MRLVTSPISSSWYPALFLTRSPTFTYHRPVCCVVSGANLLPSVRETNFNSRRIVGSGPLKDFRDNSNCTRKHPPNACACSVRPTLHKITDFHLSPQNREWCHKCVRALNRRFPNTYPRCFLLEISKQHRSFLSQSDALLCHRLSLRTSLK